jgi:Right handed beta helix region
MKMSKMNVLKILAVVLFGTAFMSAQASRTWVSGVGDDANPCSRTAPCKTFAGAISKTAAGGEIDALDPAGYGAVTITKGITIDGGGGQVASVLVSGTNGIVVQAGPSDVVILRNLRINGIGTGINGIRFLAGKALSVENCDIFGFTTNGIDIVTAGGKVFVTDTTVTNNGGVGLSVQSTASTTVSINNSRFELNNNGVTAGSNSKISVTNSAAYGNVSVGFLAAAGSGTADLNISNSTAGNNNVGIQAGGAAGTSTVRINGVSIHGNSTGLATGTAGSIRSFGNNYNADTGTPGGTAITPQ